MRRTSTDLDSAFDLIDPAYLRQQGIADIRQQGTSQSSPTRSPPPFSLPSSPHQITFESHELGVALSGLIPVISDLHGIGSPPSQISPSLLRKSHALSHLYTADVRCWCVCKTKITRLAATRFEVAGLHTPSVTTQLPLLESLLQQAAAARDPRQNRIALLGKSPAIEKSSSRMY